jgi:hypothetical protein
MAQGRFKQQACREYSVVSDVRNVLTSWITFEIIREIMFCLLILPPTSFPTHILIITFTSNFVPDPRSLYYFCLQLRSRYAYYFYLQLRSRPTFCLFLLPPTSFPTHVLFITFTSNFVPDPRSVYYFYPNFVLAECSDRISFAQQGNTRACCSCFQQHT